MPLDFCFGQGIGQEQSLPDLHPCPQENQRAVRIYRNREGGLLELGFSQLTPHDEPHIEKQSRRTAALDLAAHWLGCRNPLHARRSGLNRKSTGDGGAGLGEEIYSPRVCAIHQTKGNERIEISRRSSNDCSKRRAKRARF